MTNWQKDELVAISKDPNLYISIPNADGTIHNPAWIWIAQSGNELFCRGYSGTAARWYQSAQREGLGHISVGGVEKDVRFEFIRDEETNDKKDEGYRQKYAGSAYLAPMINNRARQSTVKLIPINE